MSFTIDSVFAGAAFLLAVASPTITAIITARTQRKERKTVFFDEHFADVYDGYMKSASAFILRPEDVNRKDYAEYLGMLLLLVDADTASMLLALDADFRSHTFASKKNEPMLMRQLQEISLRLTETYPRSVARRRKRKPQQHPHNVEP